MRNFSLFLGILLLGCAGGPPPPAWQASAKYSLETYQEAYLRGDTRVADLEFARARFGVLRNDISARDDLKLGKP